MITEKGRILLGVTGEGHVGRYDGLDHVLTDWVH